MTQISTHRPTIKKYTKKTTPKLCKSQWPTVYKCIKQQHQKQNLSHKTRVIDVSVVDLEQKEVETGLHAHFKFGEH